MVYKNDYTYILSKDIEKYEYIINHKQIYNVKAWVLRTIIQSGIAVNFLLPFIIATLTLGCAFISIDRTPFYRDTLEIKPHIEVIDTSSGYHFERKSYDFEYENKDVLEVSTGWKMNQNGLYEREITTYKLTNKIDIKKYLTMRENEIKNLFAVADTKTISKKKLNSEDMMFNDNSIIITTHKTNDSSLNRRQSSIENVCESILFTILAFLLGLGLKETTFKRINIYVREHLYRNQFKFRKISENELEEMKNILTLKHDNLDLLMDTEERKVK